MSNKALTKKQVDSIYATYDSLGSINATAKALGHARNTVTAYLKQRPERPDSEPKPLTEVQAFALKQTEEQLMRITNKAVEIAMANANHKESVEDQMWMNMATGSLAKVHAMLIKNHDTLTKSRVLGLDEPETAELDEKQAIQDELAMLEQLDLTKEQRRKLLALTATKPAPSGQTADQG